MVADSRPRYRAVAIAVQITAGGALPAQLAVGIAAMYSTHPAQSLLKLFAAYHKPLPLSNQQSQKLLDGLKTSFRNQLDREYGQASDQAPASSKASDHGPKARHSAANLHLKSILTNPLFSYKRWSPPVVTSLSPSPSTSKRDPMDVFDHAVSKGLMTIGAATGCLVAKRELLQAQGSSADSKSSGTATRIVRWLRSSGAETSLKFLDKTTFLRELTPFLIAEGLEAVAWEWMTRAVSYESKTWDRKMRIRRPSALLNELVRTKSKLRYGDLDGAISTILEAWQRFQDSPLLRNILITPWRSVSWLSTVEAYSRTAASEKLFDAHMAMADLLPVTVTIESAHLHLYHPTRPDHTPALHMFSDKEQLWKLVRSDMAKSYPMGVTPWIFYLGQDTIAHLTREGKSREADDITELLLSDMADMFHGPPSPT